MRKIKNLYLNYKKQILLITFILTFLFLIKIVMILSDCKYSIYIPYCTCSSTNLKNYSKKVSNLENASQVLPKIEYLPLYEEIYYKYRNTNTFIITEEAIMLVVKYDELTYKKEKDKLSEKQYFEAMAIHSDDEPGYYTLPESEIYINDFTFRMLMLETNNYAKYLPKNVAFIGTSDKKKTIAYLYFYCYDCDYVSDEYPIKNFIKKHFKYNW